MANPFDSFIQILAQLGKGVGQGMGSIYPGVGKVEPTPPYTTGPGGYPMPNQTPPQPGSQMPGQPGQPQPGALNQWGRNLGGLLGTIIQPQNLLAGYAATRATNPVGAWSTGVQARQNQEKLGIEREESASRARYYESSSNAAELRSIADLLEAGVDIEYALDQLKIKDPEKRRRLKEAFEKKQAEEGDVLIYDTVDQKVYNSSTPGLQDRMKEEPGRYVTTKSTVAASMRGQDLSDVRAKEAAETQEEQFNRTASQSDTRIGQEERRLTLAESQTTLENARNERLEKNARLVEARKYANDQLSANPDAVLPDDIVTQLGGRESVEQMRTNARQAHRVTRERSAEAKQLTWEQIFASAAGDVLASPSNEGKSLEDPRLRDLTYSSARAIYEATRPENAQERDQFVKRVDQLREQWLAGTPAERQEIELSARYTMQDLLARHVLVPGDVEAITARLQSSPQDTSNGWQAAVGRMADWGKSLVDMERMRSNRENFNRSLGEAPNFLNLFGQNQAESAAPPAQIPLSPSAAAQMPTGAPGASPMPGGVPGAAALLNAQQATSQLPGQPQIQLPQQGPSIGPAGMPASPPAVPPAPLAAAQQAQRAPDMAGMVAAHARSPLGASRIPTPKPGTPAVPPRQPTMDQLRDQKIRTPFSLQSRGISLAPPDVEIDKNTPIFSPSPQYVARLAQYENNGLSALPDDAILRPYPDGDHYSIGYGHRLRPGEDRTLGKGITKKEAEELLQRDIAVHSSEAAKYYELVRRNSLPAKSRKPRDAKFHWANLPRARQEALADIIYQRGLPNSKTKMRGFWRAVSRHDWEAAAILLEQDPVLRHFPDRTEANAYSLRYGRTPETQGIEMQLSAMSPQQLHQFVVDENYPEEDRLRALGILQQKSGVSAGAMQ